MSQIKCPHCDKRMVTEKILEAHISKRHSGNTTENTFVEPKVSEESVQPSKKTVTGDTAILESLDGRVLQFSIGDKFYKGTRITVSREMLPEAEHLLTNGKFYFKVI